MRRLKFFDFFEEVEEEDYCVLDNIKLYLQSLIFVCLIIFFISILFFGYLDYTIKHHENYNTYKSLITSSDSYLNELFVLKSLENIPDTDIQNLIDNDYKIIISNKILYEKYNKYEKKIDVEKNDLGGLAIYDEHLIVLSESPLSISFSVLHEIGHCIDVINNRPSIDENFLNCFEQEKEIIRKYAQKNPNEFFADIYGLMYIGYQHFSYDINDFPMSKTYFEQKKIF